jgi:WD40 repeat protein
VMDLTFTSDGQRIISAGRDGAVRLWRVSDGRQELVLRGHDEEVHSVAVDEDGTAIAAADIGGRLRIWSRTGEVMKLLIAPKPKDASMNSWIAALFPYGEQGLLAITRGGQTLRWRSIRESTDVVAGQSEGLGVLSADIRPDERQLAIIPYYSDTIALSGDLDSTVSRSIEIKNPFSVSWISDSDLLVQTEEGQIWSMQLNASAQSHRIAIKKAEHFATHSETGQIAIAISSDVFIVGSLVDRSLKEHCRIEDPGGFASTFNHVGNRLATLSTSGTSVWDLSDCHRLWRITGEPTVVAFSRDERWLAIADWHDSSIGLHDLLSGSLATTFSGHSKPVRAIVFSGDSSSLVSGGEDKSVRAWDVRAIAKIFDTEPSRLLKRAEEETGLTVRERAAVPLPLERPKSDF